MAWVNLRLRGWPNNFVISLTLTDSPNGQPVSGTAEFFFQKGSDPSQRVFADDGTGNPFVANAVAGQEWQSPVVDYSQGASQGYDTLVCLHEGKERLRTLTRPQTPARNPQAQSQQPKLFIDFTDVKLVKKNDGKAYDIEVCGAIATGNTPHKQAQLDFYYQGRIEPKCQLTPGVKTDDNGRFTFSFEGKPAEGKRVKLEVQVRGGIRRSYEMDIPDAPKDKPKEPAFKPATLSAKLFASNPAGDKMRHTIILTALDQKNQPISGGLCLWTVGPKSSQQQTEQMSQNLVVSVEVDGDTQFNAALLDHGITLDAPIKLSGPEKKIPEPQATLEVKLPSWPNSDGTFTVQVISKANDKPKGNVKFKVTCADEIMVIDSSFVVLGQGASVDLVTDQHGSLVFNLFFEGRLQTNVLFSLPGFSQTQLFVKPRK